MVKKTITDAPILDGENFTSIKVPSPNSSPSNTHEQNGAPPKEIEYCQIMDLRKIKNKSLKKFTYFILYCNKYFNLNKLEPEDMERVAIELFHCSPRTASEYANCLLEITSWVL